MTNLILCKTSGLIPIWINIANLESTPNQQSLYNIILYYIYYTQHDTNKDKPTQEGAVPQSYNSLTHSGGIK